MLKITSVSELRQKVQKDSSANYSVGFFVLYKTATNMSFEKGIELYKSGEFDKALEVFNELIHNTPKQSELHLNRGRVLSRLGQTEKALADFDLIIDMEPYNTNFISDRAVVLHLLKRNQEALSELDRAANLDPNNPYRYSSRAFLKDRIGDLSGAIADYDKAIELDPEDAVAYNNRGLVEEKLGYGQKSRKSFDKADDLVGYKAPVDQRENSLDQTTYSPTPFPKIAKQEEEDEMSFGHYFGTLKSLIIDSDSRRDFINYIKNIFGNKKN
jgi:tetratricopeptide (TPR) repeat protein